MQFHPFAPIVFSDSKILILGSFPSIKSFEEGFYYAHPRNQFWPLLGRVFAEKVETDTQRIALCKKHHIALWDSAKSLIRSSGDSSDSNLKDIEPNDFLQFLSDHPSIERILFTGRKAQQIFERHYNDLPIKKALLPSPSPAYAALSFDEKLKRYSELLQ